MNDLKNILDESLDYYLEQERIIAGRISQLPKGTIKEKKINGDIYYYLHYRKGKKIIDEYLGKDYPKDIIKKLEERKSLEKELRNIKESIKLLNKNNQVIDLAKPAFEIFKKLSEENLWEQGIEIIGSWCFLLYQKHLDFPKYPLRTNDLDILIPLPYKGKFFDFSSFLKSLGFTENFNPDGSTYYMLPNFKIEFLSLEKKPAKYAKFVKELNISPQQLRFLEILFQEPVILKISRGVKVKVPSPSSFFLHKLLISNRRREKGKREKDIKQAVYTGKYIIKNEKEKLISVFNNLNNSWKKKILTNLKQAEDIIPTEKETINYLLYILSQ